MKILGIETSCDDTSAAVVDLQYNVLSNIVSSQEIHNKFGGVVPELASRVHLKNIMPIVRKALDQSDTKPEDLCAVAVSVNPGLIGSLLVGVSFAKSYAWSLGIPLIAVNHMIGHICANKIEHPNVEPPYLALVVSGGHTELVWFKSDTEYNLIGQTLDDAAGEAFDKIAKILDLGYPGGPAIDKAARDGDPNFYQFPRALPQKDNYHFSYSGLKTAAMQFIEKSDPETLQKHRNDIAASVQQAIIEPLVKKSIRFARKNHIQRILLAGGVTANSLLRSEMQKHASRSKIELLIPAPIYCTDNAAMIAIAAIEKFRQKDFAGLDLNAFSKKGLRLI